jgi:hypothetical protein
LAAGSAALLMTAACGGSGSGQAGGASPAPGNRASAFAAYASCLRNQGINVPDNLPTGRPSGQPRPFRSGRPSGTPSPGASGRPGGSVGRFRPAGVDDATWQKAQDACRSVMPTGGSGRRGQRSAQPGGGQGMNAAYANCLADHGIQAAAALQTADPKVVAALAACKAISPAPAPAAS